MVVLVMYGTIKLGDCLATAPSVRRSCVFKGSSTFPNALAMSPLTSPLACLMTWARVELVKRASICSTFEARSLVTVASAVPSSRF